MLPFILVALIFPCVSHATPAPDIRANGSDGPLTLNTSTSLSITVSFSAGSGAGTDSDWWVAADTPFGWHYYVYPGMWYYAPDLGLVQPAHQGPLFDIGSVELITISGLPTGTYAFYFAVDTVRNGVVDWDHLYADGVTVYITSTSSLVQQGDFQYLGAFRLPGNGVRPYTFA